MTLISEFDPWGSPLCTCPAKLTFNPYIGCDHSCVYCYASSYIPRFTDCRPKKDLLARLAREATRLNGQLISISNSSDPYPRLEAKLGLTRKCLEILSKQNCKIQIITKSNLVARDIDLLKRTPSIVSLTITTEDESLAKQLEPNAPPPNQRIEAAEHLIKNDISTTIRIDPIIPTINDNPQKLVKHLADIGVKHVTASTLKINHKIWHKFNSAMPETARKLRTLYFEKGETMGRYLYLPKTHRFQLLKTVSTLAEKHGIKFGVCREGLSQLNTATCDGSWLTPTYSRAKPN